MIKQKVFPFFLYGFSGDVELIKILKYNTVKESSAKLKYKILKPGPSLENKKVFDIK